MLEKHAMEPPRKQNPCDIQFIPQLVSIQCLRMVLQRLKLWIRGSEDTSEGPTHFNTIDFDKGFSEDVYLPDDEVRNIHDRIRRCLDDEETGNNQEVDGTLRLMRDETERWYSESKNETFEPDLAPTNIVNEKYTDRECDGDINELVGYCLCLERNNAYLLQLIEKYEQVSFKKRYDELLTSNFKLQKEYTRLKSSNSKIYASYCDILEEIKKVKLDNGDLKKKVSQAREEFKAKKTETQKTEEEVKKLRTINDSNNHKLSELRKNSVTLQRHIMEKENEIAKLKGINIATKLKLERAENLVLKGQGNNDTEPKYTKEQKREVEPGVEEEQPVTDSGNGAAVKPDEKENYNSERTSQDAKEDDLEEQDTIALLLQKYQNKTFVT
ncbi:hypothetical protein PICMEDRAFT_71195 [Pichia membranifaciens NRRL Y-2026]|uniref:Uncharacterized protein n=1 Tax=Pichia membranifaciens NRRL Y-2026 TaxID=763406 RepID=A0A1E3NLS0_9ASCO|nr:hypothetical protein PICMEDRAFT_71195 [Pichia membranifaciens NRRL Y-2026]ODQ47074.1 hypothetical protein PICMEDRAFT_71195 [Pichia membranifaciens NRRL Y-2026]